MVFPDVPNLPSRLHKPPKRHPLVSPDPLFRELFPFHRLPCFYLPFTALPSPFPSSRKSAWGLKMLLTVALPRTTQSGFSGLGNCLCRSGGSQGQLSFICSFVSDSGLQHTRVPCPLPSPGVCSNSYPLTSGSGTSSVPHCSQYFCGPGMSPEFFEP